MRIQVLVALSVALCAGCNDYNHYTITITPRGETVERRLSVQRMPADRNAEVPTADREVLDQAYPERLTPDRSSRHDFVGQFRGQMPNDVGNVGTVRVLKSPLGSTTIYLERFRGNDDLDAQIFDKRAAADRLVDLVIAWLKHEMGNDPQWPHLERFLHQEARQDVRNLVLRYWQTAGQNYVSAEGRDQAWQQLGISLLEYGLHRRYLAPDDLPRLARMQQTDDVGGILRYARQRLARRSGAADPVAVERALAVLDDAHTAEDSLREFLRATSEFAEMERLWRMRLDREPGADPPDPLEVVGQLLQRDVLELEHTLRRPDTLDVVLRCPHPPCQTNGHWNAAERAVVWHHDLRGGSAAPRLCHASWSEADADVQRRHFGKVILDGQDLANYVDWYVALTNAERAEWDAFVAQLKPEDAHAQRIEGFQFSDEASQPADGEFGYSHPPPPPADLLLAPLERPLADAPGDR